MNIETLNGVAVYGVNQKTSKANKPYWTFDSDQGNLIVFDKAIADQLVPSNTTVYSITTTEYNETFKSRTVKSFTGAQNGAVTPKPAPAQPAQPAQHQAAPMPASYPTNTGYRPAPNNGESDAKDVRISKLSLISSMCNLMAASDDAKKLSPEALVEKIASFANLLYNTVIAPPAVKPMQADGTPARLDVPITQAPAPATTAPVGNPAPGQPGHVVDGQPGQTPTPTPSAEDGATTTLFKNGENLEEKMAARLKELSATSK